MKLLIMQFPQISRHFIPPRSKYSPQHSVMKAGLNFLMQKEKLDVKTVLLFLLCRIV
jgi:hypothetical protein